METIIQKALKLLLDKYAYPYDCITVMEESAGHYRANIEADDAARLIGKKGNVLNALQLLLKNILWSQQGERVFITVDVDNYRQEQNEKIFERVEKTIDYMKQQNLSEIKLNPMRPATRRHVHLWIANTYPELTTDSVGEGRERAIRVLYK